MPLCEVCGAVLFDEDGERLTVCPECGTANAHDADCEWSSEPEDAEPLDEADCWLLTHAIAF